MAKKTKYQVKESHEELKSWLKKVNKSRDIIRINSLIYLKEERFSTMIELSEFLGVHRRSMERWLNKYQEGGIEKMLIQKTRNKGSKIISEQVHLALAKRITDPHRSFISYVDAQNWLWQEFETQINYHWLRKYMIKHFKSKVKQPRKTHIKKDDAAYDAFLKTP